MIHLPRRLIPGYVFCRHRRVATCFTLGKLYHPVLPFSRIGQCIPNLVKKSLPSEEEIWGNLGPTPPPQVMCKSSSPKGYLAHRLISPKRCYLPMGHWYFPAQMSEWMRQAWRLNEWRNQPKSLNEVNVSGKYMFWRLGACRYLSTTSISWELSIMVADIPHKVEATLTASFFFYFSPAESELKLPRSPSTQRDSKPTSSRLSSLQVFSRLCGLCYCW